MLVPARCSHVAPSMRFAFGAVLLSGLLAGCGGSQPAPRGERIGQSTAPLPPDPNAPVARDDTGPDGVTVPFPKPATGDVGSPTSPGPTSPTTGDAPGTEPTPAGTPGTQQPGPPADAGVWSPPPDAP